MLVIRLNSPPKAPSPFDAARFNFTVILLSFIDRAACEHDPGRSLELIAGRLGAAGPYDRTIRAAVCPRFTW
jgi:hypothetical protein